MKKLTFISIGIFLLGFLFPLISNIFFASKELLVIGDFLQYLGLILTGIFLITWQSEVSRSRLLFTLTMFALLYSSLLVFTLVRANEADKQAAFAHKENTESQKRETELHEELANAKITIQKLESQLKTCSD